MAAISQDDFLKDTAQFDVARKRAQQQSASNLQTRRDALARRFAALGNLDSGARLKLEQRVADEEAENLNAANEGINAQQQAEMARRREILQGQQFQAGEAEKGRSFSAEQAAMQRAFATSERLGGQDFARGERLGGQEFARGERLGGQEFASGEAKLARDLQESQFDRSLSQQEKQFRASLGEQQAGRLQAASIAEKQLKAQKEQFAKTYGLSVDQFKAAKEQFDKTFAEEVRVNDANLRFAEKASNEKGFMEQLGSNFSVKKLGESIKSNPAAAIAGGAATLGGGPLAGSVVYKAAKGLRI